MLKVSKKWLVTAGFVILAALLYFYLNPIPFPANAQEKKNMEAFVQNMKAQCYGRFLVNVPRQSVRGDGGSYGFGFGKIAVERHANGLPHFQAYVASLEQDFATQRIRNDVSKLMHTESYSDGARMLAYYDNELGLGFRTLGLVKKENVLFKVEASGSDKADLADFSRNLQGLIPHLKPLANNTIPSGAGFCMNGGIITTQHMDGEHFSNGFTIAEFPELYFGFSTTVNGDKVDPGIIDREANIIKGLGEFINQIKTIRKGRRIINGMEAQEWLTRLPPGDTHEYYFKLEIIGKPNSISEPRIIVGMRLTGEQVGNEKKSVKMTEAEAVLLWDAVTATIRQRPGAV